MKEYLNDPMFFYAIAFVIFVGLAYAFGRRPLVGWLDSEIAKITTELEQARALRTEAEIALAECKAKQVRAEADATEIIAKAQAHVAAMKVQAEKDLDVSIKRHELLAAERIRLAEAEAINSVRQAAVTVAVNLARETLLTSVSTTDATMLIEKAIAEIPALQSAAAKAKAA